MTAHGKWSQPGIPHKGWTCIDVEDLGTEHRTTCDMCEVTEIRYVHHMAHPGHPETLGVGCICAEHMEDDYIGPRLREKRLRQHARRRQSWNERRWTPTGFGSARYLNTEGYHLTVFPTGAAAWAVKVSKRGTGNQQLGQRRYATADEAMDAALAALLWAKDHLR